MQGDHPGFATTTPADLSKCARAVYRKNLASAVSGGSVTLDGQQTHWILKATGVFYMRKVVSGGDCNASNGCVTAPSAHAASYGAGLLLSGLAKGHHVVHSTLGAPYDLGFTYTIHVH